MISPRMQIVWRFWKRPKNAGDDLLIAAARRLIDADRIGWRKHADPADYRLVISFAE